MTLEQLLNLLKSLPLSQRPGVCIDSRKVGNGDIFVAVKGSRVDGHDYIVQAVKNGAKYIVASKAANVCAGLIETADTAVAVGEIAQCVYGEPAEKMANLAVTGTNGKTTTAYLVHSVITNAVGRCGMISTVVSDFGNGSTEIATMTTPDAIELARLTSKMTSYDCKYMVAEASSHAIEQNRLAGVNFKAAAFTNLTGDHLDYHKTMEAYLNAKLKLFKNLSVDSTAVINRDDPVFEKVADATIARKIFYSLKSKADITADIISTNIKGIEFDLNIAGQKAIVKSPLIGNYNISNHLAAAGLCFACGFTLKQIAAGLSKLDRVPGRLEPVESAADFTVLVDYAHTDDALKNVLGTLKPLCKGRLAVVFGCGGDRDKTKRPRMAHVASQLAEKVYVTGDNPRTENPDSIINDIVKGFSDFGSDKIIIEPDRKKAIGLAIANAAKDDVILIAGKGHEDYQIIGKEKKYFSDIETAKEFLD